MVPVNPPDKVPKSGPADKPTNHQSLDLEDPTPTQNEMMYANIMEEVLHTVVWCDESDSQGPNLELTTCVSASCFLRGLDPSMDLAMSISGLVSKNARYMRKVMYNCAGCARILKNISYCLCGLQQDYPALLFKRTLKKALTFFHNIWKMSHKKSNNNPPPPSHPRNGVPPYVG